MSKGLHQLKRILLILSLSLATTAGSYFIVTGHNKYINPTQTYYVFPAGQVVTLPCGGFSNSVPDNLPETRGIPFNYHFYDPCDRNQVLDSGFLLDFGFWILIYGSLCVVLTKYRSYSTK
jgi:hypothetical protein